MIFFHLLSGEVWITSQYALGWQLHIWTQFTRHWGHLSKAQHSSTFKHCLNGQVKLIWFHRQADTSIYAWPLPHLWFMNLAIFPLCWFDMIGELRLPKTKKPWAQKPNATAFHCIFKNNHMLMQGFTSMNRNFKVDQIIHKASRERLAMLASPWRQ